MPRKPSPKRAQAVALIAEGFSDAAVSRSVGVSRTTIRAWRREAGFPARRPSDNRREETPRRLQRAAAPLTTPGRIVAAVRELGFAPLGQQYPTRPRGARPIHGAPAPASAPSSLTPALVAVRARLAEFERIAPTSPARRRGRPAAPILDGTLRVVLAGCGHVVHAARRDRVGSEVACGTCAGTSRRVAAVVPPGQRAGPLLPRMTR
jgi:transposase-like protein